MKGGDRDTARAVSPAGLVALRAARAADAPAILAPGRPPLSFGALAHQVTATVERLAAMGLGRASRVAVVLPNGPEMAAALYAVPEAVICAPLDPAIGESACSTLLQRMRIDAMIVPRSADLAAGRAATALGLQLIALSTGADCSAGAFDLVSARPRPAVERKPPRGDDIALFQHTSGTTSAPKIVPLTHASLVSGAVSRVGLLQLTDADRGLCVSGLSTSAGIRRSLYPVLTAGGSIVCPSSFDVGIFFDLLDEFKPTFYGAGPTVHRAVLDEAIRRGCPRHSLRFILCGTGALDPDLQHALERAFGVPAIQAYGTTETSTIAQNPLPPGQRRAGSAGLPAACRVAILGDDGTMLAPQHAGEIVVRGPAVFDGYEEDDDSNRRSFHQGWFRTGDVGHIDEDGYLFVTGRLKEIINRGGAKVLPLEVDAMLMTQNGVADAACFGVPHPTLGEDVVAAVVLRAGATVSAQQLRDALLERMAAYKVPSRIMLVDEIPRDAQGKVRRRELSAARRTSTRLDYVPPRGRFQQLVADCFRDVLGIERIGAHDNFFALGGDSLRGTQAVARLNAALGLDLGAAVLFRRPTIGELAAALEMAASSAAPGAPPALTPRSRRSA